MNKHPSILPLLLSVTILGFSCSSALAQNTATASDAEKKAAAAVEAATDPTAKVAALTDFIKKYPKSPLMARVAEHVLLQLSQVTDPATKAKLAGDAQALFKDTDQSAAMTVAAIDAQVAANKFDEAFALGEKALSSNPEDITVLVRLTNATSEAIKKQNGKFVTVGMQYGTKATELIEAKKKPLSMTEDLWNAHVKMLPRLYQDLGIMYLVTKDLPKAKAAYDRAIALAPDDPMNFAMLASVLDEEYVLAAQAYQKASDDQKPALLKKANDQLDLVIEAYAKAIAMASTKPEYQPLATQARQNLEPYFKYRNNNSTEGMEKLIDKYKPATTP